MTANALKLTIHELVNQTDDEDVLQGIYLLLKKLIAAEEGYIGYEVDGTPITDEAFIQSIIEADADIDAGNGIPFEEFKAKIGYRQPI